MFFEICLPAGAQAQRREAADERHATLEANTVLQEEIKLAARPQTYLLIDVHHGVVLVKARGIEVHRLPLLSWRAREERPPTGLFWLTARPPVDRPKTKPGEDATEHPIDLSDMPAEYQLTLEPPLIVAIVPPVEHHPWLWIRGLLREWWNLAFSQGSGPWLRIVLPPESARSLAWLVTDGMPVLIGRSTFP
ncbi:MAG TPA: hypothetical protein VES96_03330 [Nitrospiraceae bacterium]|nr:hypothetical protein [Nitrospiraceae bacterium]